MKHPTWTPYLGRKNCIPSVPVKPEWIEADTLEDAVKLFSEADRKHCTDILEVEMDFPADAGIKQDERTYNRKDYIVHAEKNEYGTRLVKNYTILCGGDPS